MKNILTEEECQAANLRAFNGSLACRVRFDARGKVIALVPKARQHGQGDQRPSLSGLVGAVLELKKLRVPCKFSQPSEKMIRIKFVGHQLDTGN